MQDVEMKKKILSEIMDLMDEKDGEMLKMHPKVVAAKVEVEKPAASDAVSIMKDKMSSSESDPAEPDMESEDDMSPEMVKKILEMYKDMK